MADRISPLSGRTGATPSTRSTGADGRSSAGFVKPARVHAGNVNGFKGRVNLSGPFDPDAPCGTYLDIMV